MIRWLFLAGLLLSSAGWAQAPTIEDWEFTVSGNNLVDPLIATKPVGVDTTGKALFIFACHDAPNDGPEYSDNLTGWDFEGTGGSTTTDVHIGIYSKVGTGSEGATESIDIVTPRFYVTYYVVLNGADTADFPHVVGTYDEDSGGSTHTAPAVTTTANDALAFYLWCGDGSDMLPVSVSGTGWAEVAETAGGGSVASSDTAFAFGTRELATAGSTGIATITSSVDDSSIQVQLAVAPAAGGSSIAPLAQQYIQENSKP